ncbi:MAG: DNA phosphorothioation-associated putative methyltransferase, partial [Spirulinaceae cyanobacterium RM2_2_10]|nr:DNA phosphorothioation-associated putative methyltransferase [Spirulinaceae cyanobacterium RM2_2_10]
MADSHSTILNLPHLSDVAACAQRSPVGKRLPDALYVHISAIAQLDPILQICDRLARPYLDPQFVPTLVKFSFAKPQLSYLAYPDFDADPHPALQASIQIDWQQGEIGYRDYSETANPPVLHRKETFVSADYPRYHDFQHLSRQQEALGLLNDSRRIGSRLSWEQRLVARGLELHDHALACPLRQVATTAKPAIERHKAAIARPDLSKPTRLALEAGLLPAGTTFFDYGCGHGSDARLLQQRGCQTSGWDPYYQPDTPHQAAQVVNLGYVINVIEDPAERRAALVQAWDLATEVLIVAAQVLVSDRANGLLAYGDGIITSRNTFQKYYDQEELKAYIDQILGVDAIPMAL